METRRIDQQILEIIKNNEITRQSELMEMLSKNGVKITQPNLSRRMEKLSIKKNDGIYVKQEVPLIKHHHVKSIAKSIPNIIVIHTASGFAGSVAAEIDQSRVDNKKYFKSILGTIAGDDTILVIVRDTKDLHQVYRQLEEFFANTPQT